MVKIVRVENGWLVEVSRYEHGDMLTRRVFTEWIDVIGFLMDVQAEGIV